MIRALCLLFGVVGRADKDCDLFRATETTSSADSSSDRDSLASIDGKLSNTGETRGRDGLEFSPSSWINVDGTRLRNGDTLRIGGEACSSAGFCRCATIVNPRGRLVTLSVAVGLSGTTVGKYGATSSWSSLWLLRVFFGRGASRTGGASARTHEG